MKLNVESLRRTVISLREGGLWSPLEDCSEISEKLQRAIPLSQIATVSVVPGAVEVIPLEYCKESILHGKPKMFSYPIVSGGEEWYQYHTVLLTSIDSALYAIDGTAPDPLIVRPFADLADHIAKSGRGTAVWWFGEFSTNICSCFLKDHVRRSK